MAKLHIARAANPGLHALRDSNVMEGFTRAMAISAKHFDAQWAHFRRSIREASGSEFQSFQSGMAAQWEDYKPRLRNQALTLLGRENWREDSIGKGQILDCVITAIEVNDKSNPNNLVRWENRFGHANRSHHALLDAKLDTNRLFEFERVFFDLYIKEADDEAVFKRLRALAGARYDLLAYLFFLKDISRFAPIATRTFDRAFALLDVDVTTTARCSWENYVSYMNVLTDVQGALRELAGVQNAQLIDAHSFCWMLIRIDQEVLNRPAPSAGASRDRSDGGTIYNARQISVYEMAHVIEQTVRTSNGQTVQRVIKNKELKMTRLQLESLLMGLLDKQDNRCSLTGIPFHFSRDQNCDKELLPSPDRIDSDGHYEPSNLQLVCRFVNFWKSDSKNEEFRRLLDLVRGTDDG